MKRAGLCLVLVALVLMCGVLRAEVSFGDKSIRVVFSDDGKLMSLSGRQDLVLAPGPMNVVPFALTVREDDGNVVLLEDKAVTLQKVERGDDRLRLDYTVAERGLDVSLELTMHGPGVIRWSLVLTNRSGVRTWMVEFPRLQAVRIGKTHEDDVMIYPGSGGAFYIDKHFIRRRQFAHVSGGGLTLGWMDLFDPTDGGLFLADVNPVKKLFALKADAMSNRNRAWNLSVARYLTVPKGESVTSHVLVGTHTGRWHAAADVYRDWFYKHFPEARYPDWMVDNVGWLHRPLSQGDDEPRATFDHYLRDAFDRSRYYGTRFIGVWGNNTDIVPCGLFHYPSIRMGGPESVRRAMDAIGKKGGRATFYINAYRYSHEYGSKGFVGYCSKEALPKDLPYEDQDWVLARAFRKPDGSLVGPTGASYQDHQGIARMDYNSLGWQRHMLDTVRRHAGWGVSLYLDESGCSAKVNYADVPDPMTPGHENYALGMLNFLKQAHREGQAHIDGYAFAGERYYELYGPYIAYQTDGRFGPFVEAIQYTHPSHLVALYHRAVPRHYEWVEKFRRAFVRAQPILFMGESGRRINLLHASIADLVRYQRGAVFGDDLGLEVTGTGRPGLLDPHSSRKTVLMRVKRWDIDGDGRRITTVNFHNDKSNPGLGIVVDTGSTGPVKHAFLYTLEEMVQAVPVKKIDRRHVSVQVPAVPVGSVVLVGQETPEKALRLAAWYDRGGRGNRPALWVGLANLGDTPREVTLSATGEHGLKTQVPAPLTLAAGEARRLDIPIVNLEALDRLAEVAVTARTGDVTTTRTAFVMPPLPNRSFERDDNDDAVPDNWLGPVRLDKTTKTHGHASAKLSWDHRLPMTARVNPADPQEPMPLFTPAGEGMIRAVNYLYLEPGHTYRVSCDFRAEKYRGRSWVALRVHAVGSASNAVLHQETVLRSPLAGSILAEMRPRPQWYDGNWRRLVVTLRTPEDLEQARVELLQVDSPEPVWFDNLTVQRVSAAEAGPTPGEVVGRGDVKQAERWFFMCDACGHVLGFEDKQAAEAQRATMPARAGHGGACPRCRKDKLFAAEYCPKCRKVYIATMVKAPDAPQADDFCPHCRSYSPTGGDL